MTRVHTGRCCCAEKPRRGVDNKAFFHLLTVGPPHVSQHCSGLAHADGWLTDPSWERAICPSHTVARQHLSHTILYKCRASPFPSHSPPRCLLQLPLDSSFFFLFFYPHSTKCGPQLVTAGQEKSESASCLSFLGTLIYCQCRKKWQRERKTGEVVEAEGGVTQTCRTNTGI